MRPEISHDATPPVDAGAFGAWLRQFRASLRGQDGNEVPCGECVGCCVSSYSILLRPKDAAALASVPAHWLREAPALGAGVKVMGYLPDGTCPMLRLGACSIYTARPETCRDYDCRVFAAAGLSPGEGKPVIEQRVRAWRFRYTTDTEYAAHQAVRAAAAFLRDRGQQFAAYRWPKNASGIAVSAVKCYEVFMRPELRADAVIAAAIASALRTFDAGDESG